MVAHHKEAFWGKGHGSIIQLQVEDILREAKIPVVETILHHQGTSLWSSKGVELVH